MSVTDEVGVSDERLPADPLDVDEAEALGAGMVAMLDALADIDRKLDALVARVEVLAEEVRPAIEAVSAMGPMAEKLAAGGGLMGLFRQ